ncbi:YddF family protein [Defluviitalea phaphyphila]|uniref:YddF family protein n=1 Tax=Defluviitalea phaphyphila TaxID=1473580 RepID=UPI000731C451|nr:YddF family protein [Defluviitalea phaphyphila]
MKIALFNGTVVTTNGLYRISDIDVENVKKLIDENGFISAIGHQSTAEIISDLLKINVSMNRIQFKQEVGQKAIAFKLNQRPPEGVILSRDEIEKIGYSFRLIERLE